MRIAGVSEGDNQVTRNEKAMKDIQFSEAYEKEMTEDQRGQSEEEFTEELNKWGVKHKKAVKRAWESVNK